MTKMKISALVMLLAFSVSAMAQTIEQQKKEINMVKKNFSQYIYVEVVDSLPDAALTKARHYLKDEIEQYAQEQKRLRGVADVVALNVKEQTITMPRGDKFRAFVYVKKNDIVGSQTPTIVAPQSTVQQLPASPRIQTLSQLLQLTRFDELQKNLSELKQQGRIGHYDKYKNLTAPERYLLIIYNKQGEIEAVLSEGTQRTNLSTKQSDDIANYKGRGAIGVIIND